MAKKSAEDKKKDKDRMDVARAISTILKHEKDGAAPAELVRTVGDFSTDLYNLITDDSPEILYECLRRYELEG